MRQPTTLTTERLLAGTLLDREIDLELRAIEDGVARYRRLQRRAEAEGRGAALKPAERLMLHWIRPLIRGVREEQRVAEQRGSGGKGIHYRDLIRTVTAEQIALTTIATTLNALLKDPAGQKYTTVAYAIGRDIAAVANREQLKRTQVRVELPNGQVIEESGYKNMIRQRRQYVNDKFIQRYAKQCLDEPWYERVSMTKLGAFCTELLLTIATTQDHGKPFRPAFEKWYARRGNKTTLMLRLSEEARHLIDHGHRIRQFLRPRFWPMIVPPYHWSSDAKGGYIKIKTPYIAKQTPCQLQACRDADLELVNEGLDALSSQPWRINRWIFETMNALWKEGGGIARIPRRRDIPMPDPPPGFNPDAPRGKRLASVDPATAMAYRKACAPIMDQNAKLVSERRTFMAAFEIAGQFVDEQEIYFPHQFDFRGRVYPIPDNLNHHAYDPCRGLLEFAPPCTPSSRWLMIHMANQCGVDKVSFDQRIHWVRANMDTFATWVDDPLRSTGWALDLDGKPDQKHAWQKLAAARALFEPEAARHLPCQIDGTCNGLQHYAALGRDPDGAAAVNLIPQDQPADVYSAVAEALRPILEREAAAGKAEAKLALSQLSRGLVKQPVMTTVYGVTELGARRQVQTKLDVDADADARYQASRYVAQRVLDAMATVCTSAAELMRWMRQCARIIAKQERIVTWRTPIGFPVRQAGPAYQKLPFQMVKTANHELRLFRDSDKAPPKIGKQTRGLPPNYVHSIDSTHLLCAAIAAADEGISLASVHDAYWSHAGSMDRLGHILREQFVALHERDLIDELHQQLCEQSAKPLPTPPEPGTFEVHQVFNAPYAFA